MLKNFDQTKFNRIRLDHGVSWQQVQRFLEGEGKIDIHDLEIIIKKASDLGNEANLVSIEDPVAIVGDIHGQFHDLSKILQGNCWGDSEKTKYLFLGDYVDRGNFSIEVLVLLLYTKITFPKSIIMLRGNHECRQLTAYFNFQMECLAKYNQDVYEMFMDLFDCLPLACLINGKFLCVHGGISHQLQNLKDIFKINRFREIPKIGLFCDLLWADPVEHPKGKTEKMIKINDVRGCSYYFGLQLCQHFMNKNRVISIIRAHQAQYEGFKLSKWQGTQKFPIVITVFSAPNYCDFYNNKGAIIQLQKGVFNIQQFNYTPHPYILPNFIDLFQWSMPFVTEKIIQMLYCIVKPNEQLLDNSAPPEFFQEKILEEWLKIQKQRTQINLNMINLGGLCPDQRLIQTGKYTQDINLPFEKKKLIDIKNEQYPESLLQTLEILSKQCRQSSSGLLN